MRTLIRIKFGSHLYGTDTPASDLDFKAVHVPAPRDILLQRVKGSISTKRPKAEGEKNYAGEIDEESYSLQRYLALVAEGQTVALDVLFAPEWAAVGPVSREWREIIANRHRLVTRRASAFVGYCRQQANKYGIKGSRVAAGRKALEMLDAAIAEFGTQEKVGVIDRWIRGVANATEHMGIIEVPQPSGATVPHWEVCGRKLPFTTSLKNAHEVVERFVSEYGRRALLAETQGGVDWKALSHAVRVGRQAIELLETGNVTFPLPYRDRILAIKTGGLPYEEVAAEIESLLEGVDQAAARSSLPAAPDEAWIDDFVFSVYHGTLTDTRCSTAPQPSPAHHPNSSPAQ